MRLRGLLILLILLHIHPESVACTTGRAAVSLPTPSSETSRQAAIATEASLQQLLSGKGLVWGAPLFIRIFKESLELEIWAEKDGYFVPFKTYMICDLSGQLGPKRQEGDQQTPEGFYAIEKNRMNPWSRFHLSMDIGYPNLFDRQQFATGSNLMIHGKCLSQGCLAMADFRIDEIYTLVDAALSAGQNAVPVHIYPFRFTEENILRHQHDQWFSFWMNLKEGDDFFLKNRIPPLVQVSGNTYSFCNPPAESDVHEEHNGEI